jgi:hypothetical protein
MINTFGGKANPVKYGIPAKTPTPTPEPEPAEPVESEE